MLCDKESCTGCMACYNACARNAIDIIEDIEGFLRPKINEDKCTKCGVCIKSCPILSNCEIEESFNKKVYACWNKDEKIRYNSTSGGLFTELANRVLDEEGVVFGAVFDSNFNVIHKAITRREDIGELRGSKYVQSNIGMTFKEAKENLKVGKKVLFSGTPCQIAGLYKYLGKRNINLITCDLVCHGVPSPKVYKSYIDYMVIKYKSPIKSINFRYKDSSWMFSNMKIEFTNNKIYNRSTFDDPFIRGFLREIFLRPSCSKCNYTNLNRVSDITIADFWGYRSTNQQDYNDDKGISLAIINSQNGEKIFEEVNKNLNYFKRNIEEAIKGNKCLSEPYPVSPRRAEFWHDYNTQDFNYVIKKYMYPEGKLKGQIKRKVGKYISRETKAKIKNLISKK